MKRITLSFLNSKCCGIWITSITTFASDVLQRKARQIYNTRLTLFFHNQVFTSFVQVKEGPLSRKKYSTYFI